MLPIAKFDLHVLFLTMLSMLKYLFIEIQIIKKGKGFWPPNEPRKRAHKSSLKVYKSKNPNMTIDNVKCIGIISVLDHKI